jgi:TolA-binding protein
MKFAHVKTAAAAVVVMGVAAAPALAQRQGTAEQRIERLERQVQEVQRRMLPEGQPASTANFSMEPAATQASVANLDNRIVALEQQLAQFLRQSEENGHRIAQLESNLRQAREDQDRRLSGLEGRFAAAPANSAAHSAVETTVEAPIPAIATAGSKPNTTAAVLADQTDAAEQAYDAGYQLWKAGKYEKAIGALRAFTSAYPKHRRTSWANNLAGRAMLDNGDARAAAEALLANYRSNPKGERAADSLYYLGQALVKLDQPVQACKAYGELEAVYGTALRAELKKLLPAAKSKAKCG